jgi:Flp pilus assembly protein TadG
MAARRPPRRWRSRLLQLGRRARRLPGDGSGQALLEAALLFPIFISLFLGVSEFSEAFTVSRRLEATANTAADLVARVRTVTNADLTAMKPMLDEMLKPYPTVSFGIIITSVVADENNVTRVAWSTAQGSGVSAYVSGSVIALPAGLTEPNSSIIFAESRYLFSSTLSSMIVGPVQFQAAAYLRPRLAQQVQKLD